MTKKNRYLRMPGHITSDGWQLLKKHLLKEIEFYSGCLEENIKISRILDLEDNTDSFSLVERTYIESAYLTPVLLASERDDLRMKVSITTFYTGEQVITVLLLYADIKYRTDDLKSAIKYILNESITYK